MFKVNEGPMDRGFRVVLGAALLWLGTASGVLVGGVATAAVVVGVVALLTGLTGFCGLYRVLGINTCRKAT